MKLKSFLGYSPLTLAQIKDWKEVFEEYYNDDGNLILVSKETFTAEQDEDIPEFQYKYVIKAFDASAYGSDNKNIYIQLYMVVIPADGVEEIEELEECGVEFGHESVTYTNDQLKDTWYDYFYDVLDNNEVVEYLNTVATVLPFIDSTRGFYLDQCKNGIGTTGWDFLRSITIGEDWIISSINRMKKLS
jgi:hypothetical protein